MPYIHGSEIDEKFQGSFEQKILAVRAAVEESISKSVTVLATHQGSALMVDEDGGVHDVTFKYSGGEVKDLSVNESTVKVVGDEDIPKHVAAELKSIVGSIVSGEEVNRTRVRDISVLLRADEDYWLSEVFEKLTEATGDDVEWYRMYEANRQEIRTKLYGKIRELESVVPRTRYSRLPADRLGEFEDELRESMGTLRKISSDMVDEFDWIVFDECDEFLCAVRQSLIAEAQATARLLSKAEKLMASEDMPRTAEAHDGLAERAKNMVIVSEWLRTRAPRSNEE